MNILLENVDYALELLKEVNIITDEDIEKAKELVAESPDEMSIFDALIKNKAATEKQMLKVIGEAYGIPYIDLSKDSISMEILDSVPAGLAKKYEIIPYSIDEKSGVLTIVVADPTDMDKLDSIRFLLKKDIEAVCAPRDKILSFIDHLYGAIDGGIDSFIEDIKDTPEGSIEHALLEGLGDESVVSDDDAPIVKYVSTIIMDAFKKRASDIHIEPLLSKLRIRYRIDGVLVEVEGPPRYLHANIVSRIKIMSKMDIAEKRIPQDGRIRLKVNDKAVDLRVSTIPTSHGESVVMRILDKSSILLDISTLGFAEDDLELVNEFIRMADGIFLITGPTGSGKTTSLYSFLNAVNEPSKKIITVEDPVEYSLEGINQVQVNSAIGLDFASALRAMMRQSPNIIMIGEIRDQETAEIATNAALTGHLVFSTLHTNDAPGAITRLIDIGIKPFLVASSVKAVMAQRLVRRVCKSCAVPYEPTDKELEFIGVSRDFFVEGEVKKGRGCSECNGTGYKGRLGIYEIFKVTEDVQELIFNNASSYEIRQLAIRNGMHSLREDALRKVNLGLTTIDEVIRITVGEESG